jgi:hypothetical protein
MILSTIAVLWPKSNENSSRRIFADIGEYQWRVGKPVHVRAIVLSGMTKVGRRLLHCKLHRYDGESTRTEHGNGKDLYRATDTRSAKLSLRFWFSGRSRGIRTLAVFMKRLDTYLESEGQKQIITLKAPLGVVEYVRTARTSRSADPGRERHLKLNFGLLRLSARPLQLRRRVTLRLYCYERR